MNRRQFISRGAKGMAAMMTIPRFLEANGVVNYNHPIGFQTYPIRDRIARDFSGAMKVMAGMGYQYAEMCYPAGYADSGFGPLVNIKPQDIRKMIEDAGLRCPSCHFGIEDLRSNLGKCIDYAHGLGLSQMITPGLDVPGKTISEYKKAAEVLNRMAEKIKAAGMVTGLHNEQTEFAMLDGELIYDAIMGALDGSLVKMQFQTQVITLGYKAADYFRKYPGRFISAHLSDWTADKKQVPIGEGIINWKEFFDAAKTGGIKNFFVEMKFENFKGSATYLHRLLG